jgi:hypothetical protein
MTYMYSITSFGKASRAFISLEKKEMEDEIVVFFSLDWSDCLLVVWCGVVWNAIHRDHCFGVREFDTYNL